MNDLLKNVKSLTVTSRNLLSTVCFEIGIHTFQIFCNVSKENKIKYISETVNFNCTLILLFSKFIILSNLATCGHAV